MSDKRFALILALYVFCSDYHSGQWSRGYRILSRIVTRYNPRLTNAEINEVRQSEEYLTLEARYSERM